MGIIVQISNLIYSLYSILCHSERSLGILYVL